MVSYATPYRHPSLPPPSQARHAHLRALQARGPDAAGLGERVEYRLLLVPRLQQARIQNGEA